MKVKIIIPLILLVLASCARRVYVPVETVRSDTLTRLSHDTVRVTQRLAPVSLALPAWHGERLTRDTLSVLQNALYRSTATVTGGLLHHTLESLPEARAEGVAPVHDTLRVALRQENRHTGTEKPLVIYKERDPTPLERAATLSGYAVWAVTILLLIYGGVRWKLK